MILKRYEVSYNGRDKEVIFTDDITKDVWSYVKCIKELDEMIIPSGVLDRMLAERKKNWKFMMVLGAVAAFFTGLVLGWASLSWGQ